MRYYNKKIEINITDIDITNAQTISISGLISIKECSTSVNFFVSHNSNNNWTLRVYNKSENIWQPSISFPSKMEITAWENGKIMSWISNNIEILLFLAGKDRNLVLL